MRLIDADDVLARIENPYQKAEIARWLRDAPTIEPKKGKWISEKNKSYSGGGCWRCSNCGYGYAWDAFFEVDSFNYCPNCGVRMEKENETD